MSALISMWLAGMKWLLAIAFPVTVVVLPLIGVYDRLHPLGQAVRIMNYALPESFVWCIGISSQTEGGSHLASKKIDQRTYLSFGTPFGITAVTATTSDSGEASLEKSITPVLLVGGLFAIAVWGTTFFSAPMFKTLSKNKNG